MSERIRMQARLRRPRGLRLGPLWLWVARIPSAQPPRLGFGRIAVTDTPRGPRAGQTAALDGQGWAVVVGGVGFAALRCRSVPLR